MKYSKLETFEIKRPTDTVFIWSDVKVFTVGTVDRMIEFTLVVLKTCRKTAKSFASY